MLRAAILLLLSLCLGCRETVPAPDPGAAALARLSPRARAAQLLFPPLPLRSDSVGGAWADEAASPPATAPAATTTGTPSGLPRLLVAELEPTEGPGLTPLPTPLAIAAFGSAELVEAGARRAAARAAAAGVEMGLLSIPATNRREPISPYARDVTRTAEGLAGYVAAAEEAGLLTTVRALWVEGADSSVPVLEWDRTRLEAIELFLLRAAVEAGADAVLLGNVSVPSLSGDSVPLAFSPEVIQGVLRRDLGWDGVVMADLRRGSPLRRAYGVAEAAVRALSAGTDVLLGVDSVAVVLDALGAAVAEGRLAQSRVDSAALRVLRLRAQAGQPQDPQPEATDVLPPELQEAAVEVRLRAAAAAEDRAPTLERAAPAEAGLDEARLAALDRAIREAIDDSIFSGAALAVGRRGRLVKLEGYGRVGEEPGAAPVSPEETLFDIASLSKVVGTTTAAALLMEAGELSLDAPLRRYLPDFRGDEKDEVTPRLLLTHTSGMPSGLWLYGSAGSPREAVRQVLRQPLRRSPGERVEYSDLGMILLAEAVESAAGMPLDLLLARRLFGPLGMSSTMYLPPVTLSGSTVPTAATSERPFTLRGVVHDANAFRLGGVAGHAGIFSTALDVAVFAQMMLNGGSYGSVQLLAPETVNRFTARQPGADRRALGWDTPADFSSAGRFFSARAFGHTGYTGTSLWIDPERELFVVLLTNRTFTGASARDILQLRRAVHDAVAQAISDQPVARRRGAR